MRSLLSDNKPDRKRPHRFAALVASTLFAVLSSGIASAASTYYIDCSASAAGTGASNSPWNSISQLNAWTFAPGDTLLFNSGTTCTGAFLGKGSGAATAPITVGAYGSGAPPVINANGARAAIELDNVDNWSIGAIKLTNPAASVGLRNGLLVQSTDGAAHTGFDINGLIVDRVAGQTNKATNSNDYIHSAGIEFDADTTNGSTLNNVHVYNTQVSNTGGGGIKVRTGSMTKRGQNIHVDHNTITSAGGDGIVVSYSESPLIEYNVANDLGGGVYPFTGGNFAGMWVLGDHNPTIQFNVVTGNHASVADSQAWDCDWGNTGTCLVQYNYSRDNYGGFYLNCDGCGTSGGATQIVRYNVAQNDCRTNSVGNAVTLWMYNNTFYCPNTKLNIVLPTTSKVWNNIWVATTTSTLPTGSGIDYQGNVYQGVPAPTSDGVIGAPGFIKPGAGGNSLASTAGYWLGTSSPALSNGVIVPNNGGRDYWGNPVSATANPNRGAYNGLGVTPTTLGDTADAYVRDGTYATTNFGTSVDLAVKNDATSYARDAYLMFDLSSVSTPIKQATVYLTSTSVGQAGIINNGYAVADHTWTESGITWNTMPTMGTSPLVSWTAPAVGNAVAIDVTSQAISAQGSDKRLALGVTSPVNVGSGGLVTYASKEHTTAGYRPVLVVVPAN